MNAETNSNPLFRAIRYADNETQLIDAINEAIVPTVIELSSDIDLTGELAIPAGKDITLAGDHRLTGRPANNTVNVKTGAALTIDGVTVTHVPGQTGAGVYFNSGSSGVMNSGAITGNSLGSGSYGGGVRLMKNSSFTLNGGAINANKSGNGGGVDVESATFTMNGGEICGNTATENYGGGVYCSGLGNDAKGFTMNGGAVCGNTVAGTGGGGFCILNTRLEINGGEIYGNKATSSGSYGGGIYAATSKDNQVIIAAGKIHDNSANRYGGGVCIQTGSLEMSGGEIYACSASCGGGVALIGGTGFTMTGGEITDNKVSYLNVTPYGAGVYSVAYPITIGGGRILKNTLDGGSYPIGGGGVHTGGALTMTSGEVSGNTVKGGARSFGGGVASLKSFVMDGGTISGNKVGELATDMGGGVYFKETFEMNGGVITGNVSSGDGGGVYGAIGHVFTMSAGALDRNSAQYGAGLYSTAGTDTLGGDAVISNNRASADGGAIFGYGATDAVTVGGRTRITGNTAAGDGGGVYTANLSGLNVGPDAVFSENSASAAHERDPADDALYLAHIQGVRWTAPFTQGYNNFDIYSPNGQRTALLSVSATKTAQGADLPAGKFTFELRDAGGTLVASSVNGADGSVNLTALIPPTGTFAYTIRESSASSGGWTPDTAVYPVSVTTGSGSVLSVTYPDGSPVFNNRFVPSETTVSLTAHVSASGAPLPEGRLTFGVFDENGNLLAAASADANGDVDFAPIPVTSAGTSNWTVREITPSGGGWTADTAQFPVVVRASDDGSGSLTVAVSYPEGVPRFETGYSPAEAATDAFTGLKEIRGWDRGEIPFQFGLFDQAGNLVDTAVNSGGVIRFSQRIYAAPGVHSYTIRELTSSGGGWTTDTAAYPATVTVTDSGQGYLTASLDYPQGQPIFVNTYAAGPAQVVLTAEKTASGATLPEGRFVFGVFDSDGNLILSAAADATGKVEFPALPVAAAGTREYTLRELTPSGGGWTADTSVFPVLISASDDGNGAIETAVSYPAGMPAFSDSFSGDAASQGVTAYKETRGWNRSDEAVFEFGLFADDGSLLETAGNEGGVIRFGQLAYSGPGVHSYTIRELTPSGGGWTTDASSWPAVVTVTGGSQGRLTAVPSYPQGPPVFINTYGAEASEVTLRAKKSSSGAAVPDGMFSFGAFDANGNLVAGASADANGDAVFTSLPVSSPGTTVYTIRELTSDGGGWTADPREYRAVVDAVDDADGSIAATVTYPDGTPRFSNAYSPAPATAEGVVAYKELTNWDGGEAVFDFGLFSPDGSLVETAQNSGGVVRFADLSFPSPGSYGYTVRELPVGDGAWITDPRAYPVVFTVTDDGQGRLEASADYTDGPPVFSNARRDTPPGEAQVCVRARVRTCGARLPRGMFTFGVFDPDGNELARAVNDACGRVTFPPVPSGKAGRRRWTVREVGQQGCGWVLDRRAYTVRVTVRDAVTGRPEGRVAYPCGFPVFVNRCLP